MMWTIAPPSMWTEQSEQNIAPDQVVCYGGVWMSVVREKAGGYRIRRVLSTDPGDYLREGIAPGIILH